MSVPEPHHSFVILAYRESHYLEGCIKSVLQQTISSKVVIATATPNEHISNLAAKYNLPIYINNDGGSIGKDWNFGLRCTNSRYVTLAHQDDLYLPGFAGTAVALAEQHTHTHPLMIFNRSIVHKGDKQPPMSFKNVIRWLLIIPFHFSRVITSGFIKKSIILFSNSISCPGVTYVVPNLGDFKFDEHAKYVLDWKAWYDISQMKGSVIYMSNALHIHREHRESATSTTELQILQQEEFDLLRQIWRNTWAPKLIVKCLLLAK